MQINPGPSNLCARRPAEGSVQFRRDGNRFEHIVFGNTSFSNAVSLLRGVGKFVAVRKPNRPDEKKHRVSVEFGLKRGGQVGAILGAHFVFSANQSFLMYALKTFFRTNVFFVDTNKKLKILKTGRLRINKHVVDNIVQGKFSKKDFLQLIDFLTKPRATINKRYGEKKTWQVRDESCELQIE